MLNKMRPMVCQLWMVFQLQQQRPKDAVDCRINEEGEGHCSISRRRGTLVETPLVLDPLEEM